MFRCPTVRASASTSIFLDSRIMASCRLSWKVRPVTPARSRSLRQRASRDLLSMSNSFSWSGNADSSLTASDDSGTSRGLPFFVTGRNATRRSVLTDTDLSDRISPARMAVSIANRKAWNARAVALVKSDPADSASLPISSGDGLRSRDGGADGLLTSAMGLLLISRHSFAQTISTVESKPISRITDPGFTTASLRSRQSDRSDGDKSASLIEPMLSLAKASSRIISHLAPRFDGDRSRAYLSKADARVSELCTCSALTIRYSWRAAQSFAAVLVGNTLDLRIPCRATSARNLPPSSFLMLAIFTHAASIAYSMRNWFAHFCGNGNHTAAYSGLKLLGFLMITYFSRNAKKVVVPQKGLEPPTPSLRMTCSTS